MNESHSTEIYVCKRCGLKSTIRAAFTEARYLGYQRRLYCPTCMLKLQNQQALIFYLLLPLTGALLYLVPGLQELGSFLLRMTAVLLILIPLILLHELAHGLVAWLVGLEVFGVIFGSGRRLWAGQFAGLDWDIHLWPSGAATLVNGLPGKWYRLRLLLVYLAGPGMHLILGIVLFLIWIFFGFFLPVWLLHLLILTQITNLLLLLINIWPRRVASVAGLTGTDGLQALKLLKLDAAELEKRRDNYYLLKSWSAYRRDQDDQARQWVQQGLQFAPQNLNLLNLLGAIYTREYDFQQARQIFETLLDRLDNSSEAIPEAQPVHRYLFMNNIAYSDISINDPQQLARADDYSEQAYQNIPWQPEIASTRGAVLVLLGRVAEGIEILRTARSQLLDRHGKAENSCYLALGEIQRGNLGVAQAELTRARQFAPACFLIPRVEQALAARHPTKLPEGIGSLNVE